MAEEAKPAQTASGGSSTHEFAYTPPKPAGANAAPPRLLRAHQKGRVISVSPDVKFVGGKGQNPTAFQTYGYTSDQQNYSANTFIGGLNAMKFDSDIHTTRGGEAGTGGGVKSGSYMFRAYPLTHSDIVRINGQYAERHGDYFKHNGPKDNPNTISKAQHPVSEEVVKPPDGRSAWQKVKDGFVPAAEKTREGLETLGKGIGDSLTVAGGYMAEDPELGEEIRASPEYAAAAQNARQFWSNTGTGLYDAGKSTLSFLADVTVAGSAMELPEDVRTDAQQRVNQSVGNALQPAKDNYNQGGILQLLGYASEKIVESALAVFATRGLGAAGRATGLAGEAAEGGAAAAKVVEGKAARAAAAEESTTTSGKPGGRDVPEEPKNKKGKANCPCEPSNPVRIDTGASVSSDVEFELRGTPSLTLARHYASDETFLGPLGRGIATPLDATISETDSGDFVYFETVHRRIAFERPAPFPKFWVFNGGYKHLALAFDDMGTLILKDRGLFRRFAKHADGLWRIARIEDRNGNRITFERDAAGLIERIIHPDGLTLTFTNDADGRRTGVVLVGSDGERRELMRYRDGPCVASAAARLPRPS